MQADSTKTKSKIGDFSQMGNLLGKIENQTEKKLAHEKRQQESSKAKKQAIDDDKERLNKIGSLKAFQDNVLDNLLMHVSNTIEQKK